MQQETIEKKREIIGLFLKKGVLVSSDFLNEVNKSENIPNLHSLLKLKQTEDVVVLGSDIENMNKLINETKQQKTDTLLGVKKEQKVKIEYTHKEEPKKRESQDFVDYFNNRYRAIEKILKQHQELRETISINKLSNKKEKENMSVIGIVSDKQITKNGNLLLVLEDPTGQRRVLSHI